MHFQPFKLNQHRNPSQYGTPEHAQQNTENIL